MTCWALFLQDKVELFLRIRRERGREIKSELRHSRAYRNPDFLQKMVDHSGIVSSGSNYAKNIFDPENLHEEVRAWAAVHGR